MGYVELEYVIERIENIIALPKKDQDDALSEFIEELVYNLNVNREHANDN